MKLYSFTGSCGLATNIVLEWTGQPHTVELVNKDDTHKPEYLKLNPYGQVPTLEDDGWVLNQNDAILHYLAEKHPGAGLAGDDSPRGHAEVNRWLGLLNSDIHPVFKAFFGGTEHLDDERAVEQTRADASARLREHFERLDARLGEHDWLAGTRSIADPYLFIMLLWTDFVDVDVSGLDNLARFKQRMLADEGVQKAMTAQGLA